jgi:hypothetical protein
MQPRELIVQLEARGVVLSIKGETLHFHAPKHVMTNALRDEIRHHKADLIELLRGTSETSADSEVSAYLLKQGCTSKAPLWHGVRLKD